ncbi:hypothetical protein [Gemmata sp. SH-PL17]|uniref:hypothetical protein n=1 Tax=Gemmata sp. SH-PL17 TaxID=1630693 RepID=UPI0012FBD2CE|nr:hypothetical protein [Gemmata sp. SH-PL17]
MNGRCEPAGEWLEADAGAHLASLFCKGTGAPRLVNPARKGGGCKSEREHKARPAALAGSSDPPPLRAGFTNNAQQPVTAGSTSRLTPAVRFKSWRTARANERVEHSRVALVACGVISNW